MFENNLNGKERICCFISIWSTLYEGCEMTQVLQCGGLKKNCCQKSQWQDDNSSKRHLTPETIKTAMNTAEKWLQGPVL